jgi:BolA protein
VSGGPDVPGSAALRLQEILRRRFAPLYLEVRDASPRHAGHPGAASGGGHYEVVIVSAAFEGKTLLEQHRMVNEALGDLFGREIHALALRTVPASRWRPAP